MQLRLRSAVLIAAWSAGVAAAAAGSATVKSESLSVYAKMNATSDVVKTLKRGDAVVVEMSIAGDGGEWCGIREPDEKQRLGYVRCESLEREARPKPVVATPEKPAAARPQSPRLPNSGPTINQTPGEQRFLGLAWVMGATFRFSSEQNGQVLELAKSTGLRACIERDDAYARQGRLPPDILSSQPITQCDWTFQTFVEQVLKIVTPEQRAQDARSFEDFRQRVANQRIVFQRRSEGR